MSSAVEGFDFGENWSRFLADVDESRIATAEASLRTLLGRDRLDGLSFLDIGCGSGLFSLAAHGLGATVHSFDYNPQCVACAETLRDRYSTRPAPWKIEQGSILDPDYLAQLGTFDIVYSWGVLHHTGAMWKALEAASRLVAPNGLLAIAIYNDQGRASRIWAAVKRLYNLCPPFLRPFILLPAAARLWGPTIARDTLAGDPLRSWRSYGVNRGMSAWRDVVDWVGGWPFEVAKPDEIAGFYQSHGFETLNLVTCGGGLGCNEFVLRNVAMPKPQVGS